MGLFNFFTKEIAIDLGTANTIIIHNDKVVVDEPSIVAIERSTGKIIAVGKKAQQKVRAAGWKKAIVTVQVGQQIELFEGV